MTTIIFLALRNTFKYISDNFFHFYFPRFFLVFFKPLYDGRILHEYYKYR